MERIERMRLAAWLGKTAIMLSVLGVALATVNGDVMPSYGFIVLGCLSIFTDLTVYWRYEQEKNKYEYEHL